MNTTPIIRLATAADLVVINAIYNHYVGCSTCTYQIEPSSREERERWFADHQREQLPITVAESVEEPGKVVGWGSLSFFHPRPGYRFTVEDSVYVHPKCVGHGIGRAILRDLLVRADAMGFRAVVAIISGDQAPSIRLHRAVGFAEVGRLPGVGHKFNRWLDVVYMQRGKGE